MPKIQAYLDAQGNPDGWMFFCPACRCAHGINSQWTYNGDPDAPTIRPSVRVRYVGEHTLERAERICHSFVTDGRIEYLSDCTHSLAGQTVELPDWEGSDE
jgi:hypothetical protein